MLEVLVAADPAQDQYRFNLGWSYANLAISQRAANQLDAAEISFRRSAAVREKLANENRDSLKYQTELAATYVDLGMLERDLDKPLAAEEAIVAAIEVYRRLAGDATATEQTGVSLAEC